MKIKTVRLDDETRDVLLRSRIDGNNLTLPEQLPRDLYERVAKAITAAGGKWNRKLGCHVFQSDVRQTLNIDVETVEVVNVQQTFQAFYTPPALADQVVETCGMLFGSKVLEPSAGEGSLLKSLLAHGMSISDLAAVEINQKLIMALTGLAANVYCADFLECGEELGRFDAVVMNPPFTGGQDIKHIKHALKYVSLGGRLVSIVAGGPKQRAAFPESHKVTWIDLPEDSFKESGTGVNTAMVVIDV